MAQGPTTAAAGSRRALRLGVTGHRIPPKLPGAALPAIRNTLAEMFADLAAPEQASGVPALVVVSSLAEGADQIVAEEGLARGASLEVVLPFPPDDYCRDFSDPEVERTFRVLLSRASDVAIVRGDRDGAAGEAYEAAGRAMLARSDVLLAIWDESAADGQGGTAHVVAEALEDGKPVLLINPASPHCLSRIPAPGGSPEPAGPTLGKLADRMPRGG